ncbi:efflux transporter outer membrane subunit [Providencia vermicola]|uniref:efflux transporter outer membrane subunit n=1 Tax=Providencia vermicola TaxID=333965 RepID=UPI001CEC2D79|nr:TolC family protein [Providencia vermicola]
MMKIGFVAALIIMLSGCQIVGPDYETPSNMLPKQWEKISYGADIPIEWWKKFDDPQLNILMENMLSNNLDLQLISSRIAQSRALLGITEAETLPNFNLNTSYKNQRASENGLMDPSGKDGKNNYNIINAGIGLSWEIDMWGKLRRASESQRANFAASEYNRRGIQVSIMAELATYYFQLRSVQQQIIVLNETESLLNNKHRILKEQFSYGVGQKTEIEKNRIKIDEIGVLRTEKEGKVKRVHNAIALLIGENPSTLKLPLPEGYQLPQFKDEMSLGIPSELAVRRPDIREAEELLHKATADIGVAKADYYPRITLTGNAGTQSLSLSNLGNWSSSLYDLGPTLYFPLFDGGKITQQVRFSEEKHKEAALNYQFTILKAWHEVDNALSDYQVQQEKLHILMNSIMAEEKNMFLAENKYQLGASSHIEILNEKNDLLSLKLLLSDFQRDMALSAIQLYRSLGGGWENTYPI